MSHRLVLVVTVFTAITAFTSCGGQADAPESQSSAVVEDMPAPSEIEGPAEPIEPPSEPGQSEPIPEPTTPTKTATLYRDEWGVPHIYSEDIGAGMYALGYAQAEDRLDDIYIAMRTGLGRMAEAFGEKHVQQDVYMRIARNEELAQESWDSAAPLMKEIGEQFVAGINAYLKEHPDQKPDFALDIEPWMINAVGRAMILRWPLGTIQGDMKNAPDDAEPAGRSNQWAVHPSRSADNVPILLTDPHLTWEGLAVFYEARVHAGDLHMNGYHLIGSPVIGFGHTQHVGWAPTTGGPDTADVYEIKFKMGMPPQYEYDGEWRNVEMKMVKIDVKDGESHTQPTAYTHLGPVISEPDMENETAYVGATPYFENDRLHEQFLAMCMARNADEFYEALGMNQYMEQNIMYADTSGNIGYVRVGQTPIRPEGGYDWNAPIDGTTSATAWLGIHPIDDLVQLHNPETGYMQNCNISPANMMIDSPLTPDKYPDYIYNVSWDDNNPRGKRLVELLHTDDSVTKDEAMAIALHVYDILAVPWQSALSSAVDAHGAAHMDDADFADSVEAILAWDGNFTKDATATPLYKNWRMSCTNEINVAGIAEGQPLSSEDQQKMLALLDESISKMKEQYGDWEIAWGDIYKVGRGGQYFPVGGADFGGSTNAPNMTETLFDVRSTELEAQPGKYVANNGSGAMMLMFFHEDRIESYSLVPWGQSGDPESPHYMDQGEQLYSNRKMKETWWSFEELQGHIASERVFEIQ